MPTQPNKTRYCTTLEKAKRALRPLASLLRSGRQFRCAVDIETFTVDGKNATDVHSSNIRTVQLNWGGKYKLVLDFLYIDIKELPIIKHLLRARRVLKIIHNAAFEWMFFYVCWGIRTEGIWDTMLAQQVLDNGTKRFGFGLKDLVLEEFGYNMDKAIRKMDWGVPVLERKQIRYAGIDVKYLLDLQTKQQNAADDRDYGIINLENEVVSLFAEMHVNGIKIDETQIEKVRAEYESHVRSLLTELQNKLPWVPIIKSKLTKKVLAQYPDGVKPVGAGFGDEEFVKDAKNDVKRALEILEIPLPKTYDKKKKKFRPSLTIDNVDTLDIREALRQARDSIKQAKNDKEVSVRRRVYSRIRALRSYPLGTKLREYFETVSLYNKYLTKMDTWTNPATGRVHSDFRQLKVTGRCAMADPPLQQMPKDKWFRALFIAALGYKLLKIDYSQLELRLTAEISRDRELVSEYCKGLLADVHTKTAIKVFAGGSKSLWDKMDKEKRSEHRSDSKPVNFGLIYGQGAQGLQQYLMGFKVYWSLDQCTHAISEWFDLYQSVKAYHNNIKRSLLDGFKMVRNRITGEYEAKSKFGAGGKFTLYTLGGRKRVWTHDQLLAMKQVGVNYSRRNGRPYLYAICTEMFNLPVQGTAADGMKLAMIDIKKLLRRLRREGIDVKVVLQVHDELVFEVKKKHVAYVAELFREVMESAMQKLVQRVPIYCDVQYGDNWAAETVIERKEAA